MMNFLRSSLSRRSAIAKKMMIGKIIKTKAVVMIIVESKPSSNGNAVIKMINCNIILSNWLRVSLLYGLTNTCIKAIIAQVIISI